jgi:uncharacterized membrane protein YbhN (UPF0104 family)
MSAAIGAMYLLLPPAIAPSLADFVPLYLAALLAGIVSHAPGGLGVFEAILLGAFPAQARADVLAGLLCYRLVYNLLPFGVAVLALGVFEARQRRVSAPAPLDLLPERTCGPWSGTPAGPQGPVARVGGDDTLRA